MTEPKRDRPRWWAWCCGGAVAALVLALALGAVSFVLIQGVSGRADTARVQAELARLRQAGEPLTPGDALPKIGPGEKNAADLYEVAFKLTPSSLQLDKWPGPSEEAKRAWQQDLVAHNPKYLAILEQASRIPKCAFRKNWSEGPTLRIPETGRFRDAARALEAKAEVERRAGQEARPPKPVRPVCAWPIRPGKCQYCSDISFPIQCSIRRSANSGVFFLPAIPPPRSAAPCTNNLGNRPAGRPSSRRSKEREPMALRPLTRSWDPIGQGGLDDEVLDQLHAKARSLKPYLTADKLNYLHAMQRSIEAARKPYPEAGREMKKIRADAKRQQLLLFRVPVVSTMLLPLIDPLLWSDYYRRALTGAAQIAAAAKVFKQAHGHYPDTLTDLTRGGWRLPSDPFTGSPYHYRREKQGLAIWSVGPDLTDNGGLDYDPKVHKDREQPGYDFVFRCSR